MSRSSKHHPTSTQPEHFAEGGLFRFVQMAAALLIAARWYSPPEGAVFGETLWIAQLWVGTLLLWGWDAYRRMDPRLRIDGFDLAVGSVVLGHVASTLFVLQGQGDQRSALNLMWEWVGLGVSFFVLRQIMRTQQDCQRLVGVMLAAAVMLAGYGIWQHYVTLPEIVENYERITSQLEQAGAGGGISSEKQMELQRELIELGVPQNPVSRVLWENRLRSTEPFATFALANTLAGFLVAWLLVGINFRGLGRWGARFWENRSWRDIVVVVCLLGIAFCLVLTKSRTAWVGLIAGVLAGAAIRGAGSLRWSSRWWYAAGGIAGVGFVFFAVAALSGGFDRKVISEAPKSLEYRLQYWAGSWGVVQNSPIFGTGPGNFRPHYLHYKLPESSEEIADPHNWILDLWANGGLVALLGFLAVLVLAMRSGWRLLAADSDQSPAESTASRLSAWEVGAGLAVFLVLLVRWLSGELLEWNPLVLALGWAGAWWVLRKPQPIGLPILGILAGGVALLVHLLGAGGIEMPAITQTLLVLVVVLSWREWKPAAASPKIQNRPNLILGIAAAGVAAFVLCLTTATLPVWYRTILIGSGDAAISLDRNFSAAVRYYEQAAEADPRSPEPSMRLAELYYQRWQTSRNENDFERATQFAKEAIERDPMSNVGYRRLGLWYFERAKRHDSESDAKRAAESLSQAVERYPNFAPLRAELAFAFALAEATPEASEEARKALALDEINREAGHRDKYLSPEMRQNLENIAR